ncbi:MAG: hypothetical protein ACYTA5_03880 [Planctomycetota bacterium]
MGFESEYEHRRVQSSAPGRKDTIHENSDLRFYETLGMSLAGDVIDPNLFDWQADLELGLTQSRFEERIDHFHDTDQDTGFLLEFDISADIFKAKPISLNAYARRTDDRIPRRFLPSLREKQIETGISALILKGPFTTEIGFSWRDVDRSGNRLDEDDENLRNSRFYIDHKWEISDNHQLRLTYDHQRDQSEYQGSSFDFDTRRDELRVEHELAFGPGSKHRLDTYLRYNEEHGNLARDEFEFVPRLTLQHTDKFKTVYRYGFYRFEQDAIEVGQHKFDVEALYQPSDRWRISLDGFTLYENVDEDVDTYEFGGGFDVAYDRPTSLGQLSVNLALDYDRSRTTGDAGRRIVRDEAHSLTDARPVFLRERGVIQGTVFAHNANRSRHYIRGIDYVVIVYGGRVQIRRLLTGRIVEDEVVYFDYAYIRPASATVDTYRTDFIIEHAFKFGLTPYYYFESRCQEVEGSIGSPFLRDNTDRHRLGLRYQKERWSVGGELEIFDDSIEPYDAFHLTGQWAVLRSQKHTLDLLGEISRYDFEGGLDGRRVWWMDFDLKDRLILNRYFSITTEVGYRREDDSVDGLTNGVDVECGLSYTRGYLTVDLTMEYDLLNIADNRDNGFGVFLNVRRNLSHLLPARGVK